MVGGKRSSNGCQEKRKVERVQSGTSESTAEGLSGSLTLSFADSTSIISSHPPGPRLGAETVIGAGWAQAGWAEVGAESRASRN